MEAVIPVPPGPEGWTLSCGGDIDIAGFTDLAAFFGGDPNRLATLLAPLGTLRTFALTNLFFRFHPPPAGSIDEMTVGLKVAEWTIPALPWFTVDTIHLEATVTNPLAPGACGGTVRSRALLSIVDRAWLTLEGRCGGADGMLEMATVTGCVDLVSIADLSQIVTPQQVDANIPPELPIDGEFSVGQLAFAYQTAQGYLPRLLLSLETTVPWTIVADLLVLDGFSLELEFHTPGPGQPTDSTGAVVAPILLAGVPLLLRADKPAIGDSWTFRGFLPFLDIDFADLVAQFLGADTVLPAGYGFPTALTIRELSATLVPSRASFRLTGEAFTDWIIPFGRADFLITGLQGDLDIPGGAAPSVGWIGGTFRFEPMTGAATLRMGGSGTPMVVAVDVANALDITPRSQVDRICGKGSWETVPAPADFTDPSFYRAGVLLDLTDDSYLVHGVYRPAGRSLYGAVVLLVGRRADGTWGFALSAALADWTFAPISAPPAVVDTVLGVRKAGAAVSLSSLDGDAGPRIAPYIPALGQGTTVARGLNLFAILDFSTGLLPQVASLLGITTQGPFTVRGHIPADSAASRFEASLGNLTLLGVLSFDSLTLTYEVADSGVLTLTGVVGLTLPTPAGGARLDFAGSMTVNNVAARFRAAPSTESVVDPLGIPGVVMSGLSIGLDYVFATVTPQACPVPAIWRMRLDGTVAFPGDVALAGKVLFEKGSPILSAVEITEPLSVDALFQQMVGSAWPAGLLDVVFRTGAIWYAPAAVTVDDTPYAKGFNARALTSVYTLVDILLSASFTEASADGSGGMVASAQARTPIDWGFVSFHDPSDPALGPVVAIDSGRDPFQVRCGIALFGSPAADCVLTVTDSTMAGTLTVPGSMGPFGNPTMGFTWDNRNGFQVADWSLSGLELPDFSFDAIHGSGNCRQTVIDHLPIDSRFNLDTSLVVTLRNGVPSLTIVLNGTFDRVVRSAAYPRTLLTAHVVDTELVVPFPGTGRFTWDDLADSFILCLQDAADSIFRNLLEDPANLAKLLAVEAITFATGEVAAYLICRDIPAATAESFAAATPATPGAPRLSWSDGLSASWDPVAAADHYVVAYGTSAATPVQLGSVQATTAAIPGGAGPTCWVRLVSTGPGGVSAAGPEASIRTDDVPTGIVCGFADPVLSVRWDPVAGASRVVSVSQGGQPVPASVRMTTANGCEITADRFETGGTFTITVTSVTPSMGNRSSSVDTTIGVLQSVGDAYLCYGPGAVFVDWNPVAGATGYVVQTVDADNAPLSPQPSVVFGPNPTSAALTGGTLASGLIFDRGNNALIVGYGPVPGAEFYNVDAIDESGRSVSGFIQTVTSEPATVTAHGLTVGNRFGITIRACATKANGAWSTPVDIVPATVDAPDVLSVILYSDRVTVTYTYVANATSYTLTVSPTQPSIYAPRTYTSVGNIIVIPTNSLTSGMTYSLSLYAFHADSAGCVPTNTWNPAPRTAVSRSPAKPPADFVWNPYHVTGKCLTINSWRALMQVRTAPQYDVGGIGNFSIQVTIRVVQSDPYGYGRLIDRLGGDLSGRTPGYRLSILENGNLGFVMSDGNGTLVSATWSSPPDLLDGNWHDIVVRRQRGANDAPVTIQVDGRFLYTDGRSWPFVDVTCRNDLWIGFGSAGGRVCDLTMIRLWSRALADTELGAMRFGPPTDRTGLVGEWTFESYWTDDTSTYQNPYAYLLNDCKIVDR
ncbi:hypothetical protein HL658_14710 [Azospirillum sp. RWY-5-1]|uniref:Fibronectin type-III domain-containing protein n=1 Tax=Azospirillum oleiclasticum TaxID=2735135 RepID=A0ABX2TA61_9PROT|nr:hypothetical protein [Azospirillum oleiclasticum]NYZ13804.1 hypothetical protein [Azospirillum oleiclasticum]NYZ21076.1 hypothetical protein [Azospirillum oleiclasticum]